MPGLMAAAAFSLAMMTPSGMPAGQRLGGGHHVRQDYRTGALVGEIGSGPADAALDFVGDQQGVVAVGELARLGGEFVGQRIDAALALNHFQHDAGGALAEGRFERRNVVRGNEPDARQQRFEIAAGIWAGR